MAIPTAKITTIRPLTQVAPPKIYKAEIPSIPLLGSPASGYQKYLKEKQQRSSWFFNINDPGQVNSVADVVMNTVKNLWEMSKGEETLGSTIRQTAEDSMNLVTNGIINPIIHKDYAALGLNQLINVGETVDIIDNIWKGYWTDGTEGIKRAAFDRYNYEWKTTGNFLGDFAKEVVLSPTNLLTLGLGGLAKATAKTAAMEAGQALSKRVTKSLARNYTGDMTSTIVKMQKNGLNLTANQVTQLQDVAVHATNLKLLKSVNKFKVGANFVDDIGPKLVYGSTFLPFKYMIQGGISATAMTMKYVAQALDRVDTNISTVNLVKNSAKYAVAIKSLADAVRLAGEDQIELAPFEDIVSNVSKIEVKQFKDIYKKYSSILTDRNMVQELIQNEAYIKGQAISFEVAQEMHISAHLTEFIKELDAKAFELSGETFKDFNEYSAAVSKLYYTHESGLGIETLYQYTNKLNRMLDESRVITTQGLFRDLDETLSNFHFHKTNLKADIKAKAAAKSVDELTGQTDMALVQKDIALDKLEMLVEHIAKNPGDMDAREDLFDMVKEYRADYDEATGKWSVGAFDVHPRDIEVDQNAINLEYATTLAYDYEAHLTPVINAVKVLRDQVKALKKENRIISEWADKALADFNKASTRATYLNKKFKAALFPPKTDERWIGLAELWEPDVNELVKLSKELIELTDDLRKSINNLTTPIIEKNPQVALEALFKRTLGALSAGGSVFDNMLNRANATLGNGRMTNVKRKIKEIVVVDGVLNRTMLEDIYDNVADIQDELVYILQDTDVDPQLKHALDDVLNMTSGIYKIDENGVLLTTDKEAIDSLAELLESLRILQGNIEGSIKRTAENNIRHGIPTRTKIGINDDTGVIASRKEVYELDENGNPIREPNSPRFKRKSVPTVDYVGLTEPLYTQTDEALNNALGIIDSINRRFDIDSTVLITHIKGNMREYQMRYNAFTRNLRIMNTEAVHEMLNMIDGGIEAYDEGLKAMSGLSFFKLNDFHALVTAIGDANMKDAATVYDRMVGVKGAFNPDMSAELVQLYDEISTLKSSALAVMDTLEGMASVRKFYGLVDSKEVLKTDSIDTHFLDAIQWYYDRPATLAIGTELKTIIDEIKENVNLQLRNTSNKHNYKLENWRDNFDIFIQQGLIPVEAKQEFDRIFPGGMSHTAVADSYTEYMIRKYILKNDVLPDTKLVYSDLETSTLNKSSAVIHQQSVVIPESGVIKWYINTGITKGQEVSDKVLRLLFDDEFKPQYELSHLKKLYNDVHVDGNMDALRNHFRLPADSPIEIIPVKASDKLTAEAELIMQAEDFIKTQAPPSGRIQIAMYNGKGYDAELLENRRKALGISGWIKSDNIVDTRLDLEESLGVKRLNTEQEEAIEDIIHRYISIRNAELHTIASNRGTGTDSLYKLIGPGKFLPTVDDTFLDALHNVTTYFSKGRLTKGENALGNRFDIAKNVVHARSTEPGLDKLNEFASDIRTSAKSIKDEQDILGELHLVAGGDNYDKRLIESGYFDGLLENLKDKNNIGIDLMTTNRIGGLYVPALSTKLVLDHNLVDDWFNIDHTRPMSRALAERMTDMGRDISRTLNDIKNGEGISEYLDLNGTPYQDTGRALTELHAIHDMITVEINKVSGVVYLSPVIKDLKKRNNTLEEFAAVNKLWNVYAQLVRDMKKVEGDFLPLYDKIKDIYPERALDVRYPQRILNGISGTMNHAKSFKLEPADPELRDVLEFFEQEAAAGIRTLEILEQMQEDTVSVARLKRLLPMYRPLAESFRLARDIADRTPRPELAYTYLRMPMEAMSEMFAYQKMVHTLSLTPASMASYLWHYGNGLVTFHMDDLVSKNYFKRRNGISSIDVLQSEDGLHLWQNIMDNKELYEAEGISFKVDNNRVKMFIKKENLHKFVDRPYERFEADFNIDRSMNTFLEAFREPFENLQMSVEEIRTMLESVKTARHHLINLIPDGMTSTLEKMDGKVMEGLMRQLDVYMPGVIDTNIMRQHNRFAGNSFNHSVLGSIESRRELMPYTSFNPAKTMFHAAELTHSRVTKQAQFTMLLQDPMATLNVVAKDMTHEQIFEYMQNAPHLKLGFLQTDKRRGYKMSSVILNSPDDVQFALDMNAVVLDRNTFVKAYEVINENKIPEGLFKFLEHAIIAPFKIGWMAWNIGTVMRNFADSGLKNLQSTGDLRIVPEMAAMFKSYWNYKQDIKNIMEWTVDHNVKPDIATLEYFRTNRPLTDWETFQMIDEFKKSGSSSGMVREMQEYYGDAIQRLYRHLEQERSGVSAHEFRMVMRMETEEASQWLQRLPQLSEVQYTGIMNAKADLMYYKRAYAMNKHKNATSKHLAVEDFVTYLKRGNVDGFIPPELTDEMSRLMEATKNITLDETMFEKFMGMPIVDKALDFNAGIEEVMRLAMYKHLKAEGYSVSEAMAEIIRTHFDYGHKTQAQMYMEMVLPFSTFRLNSFLYWLDELSKSSMGMEIVAKYWRESSNVDERDPEDFYLRRGLQYQMLSGNPVLNQETGLSLKLSPSVMDALSFTQNPVKYMKDSVFMVDEVKNFITMETYQGESEEDYERRKIKAASKLIPFVGPWIDRAYADKEESFVRNLVFAPLVNRTWTPAQRTRKPRFYYQRANYRRYTAKKISRARFSTYSPFNKIYYGAMYRNRNGNVYPTKAYRSVNRWHKVAWTNIVTRGNKPRNALLLFPTNKYTLKMKVQLLRRFANIGR